MNKKLKLVFGLVIGLLVVSCSDDSEIRLQPTSEELLVQNSPWIFKNYDFINIIADGNSNPTIQELENDIDQVVNESTLAFNQNGTGSSTYTTEGQSNSSNWKWKIINSNELIVTFTRTNGATIILKNLMVTSTKMSYEQRATTRITNNSILVIHYGTYNFLPKD